MGMTKQHLVNIFENARTTNASFVFVAINAEGIEEVIAIPRKSFEAKQKFYRSAYNEELVHVMNSKVRISGLSYGESDELDNII